MNTSFNIILGLTSSEILVGLIVAIVTFVITYQILSRRTGRKRNQFLIDSLVNEQEQYILFLDFDSRVVLANKSFEELSGIPSQKMTGHKLEDLQVPRDVIDAFLYNNHKLEKGYSTTITYSPRIRLNKETRWLQIQKRSLVLDNPDMTYILIVASDISEKKHVEQQLSISKTEYQQLVESAQDIIYRTDLKGNFLYVNSIVSSILGYSEEEFVRMNFFDLVVEDDKQRVKEYYREIYEDQAENYLEFRMSTKSGKTRWMGQSISFIRDNGIVVGFQSVCRDISNMKEAENKLTQAKELAEAASLTKSQFIASLSHEFRTPLNSILGYAQIMKRSDSISEDEKAHVGAISKAGEQLLGMVNEIIELSALDSNKTKLDPELIELKPFFENLNESFKRKAADKHLEYICTYSDLPDIIEVDVEKVSTILKNLLDNAIKFTDTGAIRLSLEISGDEVNDQHELQITVQDSGIGISEENLSLVYEPFWQQDSVKYNGTGLGLTLTKRFAEFMGGSIEVESQEMRGTKVSVRIPINIPFVSTEQTSPVSETTMLPDSGKGKIRVLIVDDVEANRTLTRIIVRERGFDFREANNGKQAVETCTEYKPHIVLMDINMPVMNGIEAMLRIRSMEKAGQRIPIVAITAGGLLADKKELLAQGFTDYLLKPFKEEQLIETIKRYTEPQFHISSGSKEIDKESPITFKDVYRFIEGLDDKSKQMIEEALHLQVFELISNLPDVLGMDANESDPSLAKLVSAANDYDYLFIVKLLKEIREKDLRS